jgi:antitoxin CcdA
MFSCLTSINQSPKSKAGVIRFRQHDYRYLVDSDSEEAIAMHQKEDIILSAMMERNRAEALPTGRQEQWLAENKEQLDAYNQHVEALGVFSTSRSHSHHRGNDCIKSVDDLDQG